MVKFGIDARLLTQTGVGVYTYNLLYFLGDIIPRDWELIVYAREEDRFRIPHKNKMNIQIANQRWHSLSEQTSFLLQLLNDNLDLMHFTYFSYPIFYRRPFISTIHDVTPILFKTGKVSTKSLLEYYPKYYVMKDVIRSAIKYSQAVITPTKSVAKQIESLYGPLVRRKIYPIHEGINEELIKSNENVSLKKKFKKPFFIYIGNFYPHKNIERLIRAYANIKTDHQLVLVGPNDHFSKRIVQLINQLDVESKVIMFHNPTLTDMVFFYKNAQALIHPSLSEGFGLTTLEAAYFGCPIVASDIAVFKETLGREYLSFNPTDEEDIRKKLIYVIEKKPEYNLNKVVEKFSFKRMAGETLKVYTKALTT